MDLFMVSFNIPLLMVVVFLLLTLVVVFHQTNIPTTFREYAVGYKQFDTAPLVATVLATVYGGGIVVRNVEKAHNMGLYWILVSLLVAVFSFWLIGWLALHMTPFMYNLSMSETIGRVYGDYPRVITAIANVCYSTATVAIQINVMSLAISMCIDSVHPRVITFLVILLLIFYVTIGGIRFITFMDIVQLFAFFFMFPLLFFWIPKKIGTPPPEMLYELFTTQEKFQFSNVLHYCGTNPMAVILNLLSILVCSITPPVIQRVYMSSDRFQASNVFFIAGVFSLLITILMLLIGLLAVAAVPQLPVTEVWHYLVADIPPVIKGFVAIGLLAVSMSTADSYLNTASVMLSHDIVNHMMHKKTIPFGHQLRLAKLAGLLIGIVAIILSYCCSGVTELHKLCVDCFIPIVTAPFILAVLGFRGSSLTALIGMATGILVIYVWNKWMEPPDIHGAFPSMVANGLAMLAVHYLLPQPAQAKGKFH